MRSSSRQEGSRASGVRSEAFAAAMTRFLRATTKCICRAGIFARILDELFFERREDAVHRVFFGSIVRDHESWQMLRKCILCGITKAQDHFECGGVSGDRDNGETVVHG